jgi:hypothetical protein
LDRGEAPAVPVRLKEHPDAGLPRGSSRARKESLPYAALSVLTDVPAVRFAEIRDDDGACWRSRAGAVWRTGCTSAPSRSCRRPGGGGFAVAAYQALAQWATSLGGEAGVSLQVEEHNEARSGLTPGLGSAPTTTYSTYIPP